MEYPEPDQCFGAIIAAYFLGAEGVSRHELTGIRDDADKDVGAERIVGRGVGFAIPTERTASMLLRGSTVHVGDVFTSQACAAD